MYLQKKSILISFFIFILIIPSHLSNVPYLKTEKKLVDIVQCLYNAMFGVDRKPCYN